MYVRLTGSLVEQIADAFAAFTDRYRQFFRTRTRDCAAAAGRYLGGLAQAADCTFAEMATVVDAGCAQQFQHFISNSPWDHEAVVAQIGRDADRLLGGKPSSSLIIDESSFAKTLPTGLTRGRVIVRSAWRGNGPAGWARWIIVRSRCSPC
jgi:SRSO17 transposase